MTSKLWEPIQENNKSSMPAVHHYTSIKGVLGIFESGRMWFTERTHLNDPSKETPNNGGVGGGLRAGA